MDEIVSLNNQSQSQYQLCYSNAILSVKTRPKRVLDVITGKKRPGRRRRLWLSDLAGEQRRSYALEISQGCPLWLTGRPRPSRSFSLTQAPATRGLYKASLSAEHNAHTKRMASAIHNNTTGASTGNIQRPGAGQ